ncbi:MAG: NADP(H)-dependent aldo-keto reductase [Pseudomonadota bacterium]
MNIRPLGTTDLRVSELCLGTMTFGEQNSEAEAHAQLDLAVAHGVNFIDVAEMYPVPPRGETQGRTEAYVGSWLARQVRDRLVIATKVTGPARGYDWIRGGPRISAAHLREALEGSLRRLRTDYVDLYQIHWPDRYVPMFGETSYDASREREAVPILEQLETLAGFVREGKVRHIGLSNETPWGVCEFMRLAREHGLPRIATIQNAYHLLNRTFETGLAEVCHHLEVPLLAYSPLAFGMLSGKYLDDPRADGRLTRYPAFGRRYAKPNVSPAAAEYVRIARAAGLDPARMALAFVASRRFVGATIIGATSLEQLEANLGAAGLVLSGDVLAEIEQVHLRYPNPAP